MLGQPADCPEGWFPGTGPGDAARDQALRDRMDALELYAGGGQATQDLLDAAREALEGGHPELADQLLDRLELYQDLASTDPRGEYLRALFAASDSEFQALMAEGTMYFDSGAYNTVVLPAARTRPAAASSSWTTSSTPRRPGSSSPGTTAATRTRCAATSRSTTRG